MQEKNREVNRFQKMLEGGNIKLSGTVSDINGKSSRNILNEILSGNEINAEKLEELVDGRLKAPKEQILEDIRGVLSPVQRKLMNEVLKHIDELDRHIKALDDDIDSNMGGNCAYAAVKVKGSYFSVQFARISTHRGEKEGICGSSTFHTDSGIPYIKDGVGYKELGADYYNQFNKERKINGYLKKLKKLGWSRKSNTDSHSLSFKKIKNRP